MHISFQPKPLRILAALASVILFFLLLPKCYTTTASADSGEYTVTYTAQQAADAPSPDGEEIFLISHDVTIRYPQMHHIEVRLRPAYPISKDMELYVYMYDMQGRAVFSGDLAVLELSPYTCTQLPFSGKLEKGETYRIVISDRKDSASFSSFEALQKAGSACIIHSDTPFEEISFDCYIFGGTLHRTHFLLLVALCAGAIFLFLFRISFSARRLRLGAALLSCAFAFLLAMENIGLLQNAHMFAFPPGALMVSGLGFAAAALAGFAVTTHLGAGVFLASLLWQGLAIANYYTLAFRGSIMMPTDILAAGTAFNVLGNYQLTFPMSVCLALLSLGFTALLAGTLINVRYFRRGAAKKRLFTGLGALAGAAVLVVCLMQPALYRAFGCVADAWDPRGTMNRNGFTANFLSMAASSLLVQPEGYSAQALRDAAVQESDTAAAQQTPNVVLIMNESWADLTANGVLSANTELAPFFHSLKEAPGVVTGSTVMPVFGSGTPASEFEALTGTSYLFGLATSPYAVYAYPGMPSLASQFSQIGYDTTALHPLFDSNWARSTGYPRIGFDTFLHIGNMKAPSPDDFIRGYVTDRYVFSLIRDTLAQGSAPQFVFCVTMQNHGGYLTDYYTDTGFSITSPAGNYTLANEYLQLVQETDRAFAAFTQMLEELDDPTVVLMFGDHLPSVEEEFLDTVLDAGDPFARRTTPFVLWANYDADFSAFESGMTLSSNYLAPMLVQAAGLPMTGMQKFLWQLHSEYPVVSNVGLMTADGVFVPPEEGVLLPAIHNYSMLEYNYLKGCREIPEFYELAQE